MLFILSYFGSVTSSVDANGFQYQHTPDSFDTSTLRITGFRFPLTASLVPP